ncbi:MAG: DUF4252 domain-containing protein [Pirellulales bacterium]
MSRFKSAVASNQACIVAALMLLLASTANARPENTGPPEVIGRVEFDFPHATPATVEVDLGEGILTDFMGIAQAVVGGVVEGLLESAQGQEQGAVKLSGRHLASVRKVLESIRGVVREVRVRVYENLPEKAADLQRNMSAHYQQKAHDLDWDNLVRVNDGHANVSVSALRHDGAIRGLYVMVSENGQLVLVNIVCNLSPEMVQQVAKLATQIGLEVGLEQVLQEALREIGH